MRQSFDGSAPVASAILAKRMVKDANNAVSW